MAFKKSRTGEDYHLVLKYPYLYSIYAKEDNFLMKVIHFLQRTISSLFGAANRI